MRAIRQSPRYSGNGRRCPFDEARRRLSVVVDRPIGDIAASRSFADGCARCGTLQPPVVGTARRSLRHFELVRTCLASTRDGLGHELIHELVKAGLTAEVL
jgi:hypothetical protein